MALDWLLDPVTEEAPCGPDLERSDDGEFLDYYFEAEGRLPERYFTPGAPNLLGGTEDLVFDPRSVQLKREVGAITALLQRSRDLRLLSLLARFQILAARPADFATTLEAMAELMAARLNEVHPQLDEGVSERRGALDALAEQTTVVMPLVYLPLLSHADVSYRRYLVASGEVVPRGAEAESEATTADLISLLKNPSNAPALSQLFAELTRAALALRRIAGLCMTNGHRAFTPDFTPALDTISDLQRLIREAVPGLTPWSETADAALPEVAAPIEAATAAPEDSAPVAVVAPIPTAGAVQIANHAEARATIEAAETYLAAFEPSSLSLLLVTQARLLVGKSIVEAIELLRPQQAELASFNLGSGLGFSLDMGRLRMLAQSVPGNQGDSPAAAETKPAAIRDRGELAASLRGVEDFYLRNEPASPVPVLLGGARTMLTKTFDAILSELLPSEAQQV
ncbi:type VI secretion system ImpA family N-terminal domain-containing protein [Paracoccus aminophilus]|uniref:Type VI secretion system protein ImpA n=1 Tax=Paracoccus aminophilus JCM 7686 TaxID=1367847 RepID=S5Z263_PARAH|nr:type VI secretion system ImpA family N-terminal domain-containing protein [Paracoccus aminophilus]AGT11491.1 type VI secretion system protein ImpA [Paracoccus aminophilus JCM 7686]